MASESSSKRAQAMNDSFKSPSLTSSNRKEIPLPSKKFEYKIEKTVPNPADAFDDNASNIQESKYSIIQNNGSIGKKHAFKEYDQFALNTSCFWGKYHICVISRKFL